MRDDVLVRRASDPGELAQAGALAARMLDSVDPRGVTPWFSTRYALEPTTIIAVAVTETVIGTLLSRRFDQLRNVGVSPDHLGLFSLLQYVAVDRAYHRAGIGKRLVEFASAELRATGVRWWVGGAESADAGSFFERCGFTVLPIGVELCLFGDQGPALNANRPGYRWFHQDL